MWPVCSGPVGFAEMNSRLTTRPASVSPVPYDAPASTTETYVALKASGFPKNRVVGMAGMRLGYALCSEANARKLREHGFWGGRTQNPTDGPIGLGIDRLEGGGGDDTFLVDHRRDLGGGAAPHPGDHRRLGG